ncbi:hypothetical protein Tco_0866134 [Tanacetum coccineum]
MSHKSSTFGQRLSSAYSPIELQHEGIIFPNTHLHPKFDTTLQKFVPVTPTCSSSKNKGESHELTSFADAGSSKVAFLDDVSPLDMMFSLRSPADMCLSGDVALPEMVIFANVALPDMMRIWITITEHTKSTLTNL